MPELGRQTVNALPDPPVDLPKLALDPYAAIGAFATLP